MILPRDRSFFIRTGPRLVEKFDIVKGAKIATNIPNLAARNYALYLYTMAKPPVMPPV